MAPLASAARVLLTRGSGLAGKASRHQHIRAIPTWGCGGPHVLARPPNFPFLKSSRQTHDGSATAEEAPSLAARFMVTAEVCASKIAPAGAGWWAANALAADCFGLSATDVGYFVTTGLGDASAVWLGHSVYFLLKSQAMPSAGITMSKEIQTATFLGGATFLSGFVWQPVCNALAAGPFLSAAVGVGAACGSAFLVGLRGMRAAMSSAGFAAVEHPTPENLGDDAALSVSIAAATGTFVGVVIDFADNPFLGTPIAILATASTLSGCFSSAQATCLGFASMQGLQNMFYKRGANWIDGALVDGTYKTS